MPPFLINVTVTDEFMRMVHASALDLQVWPSSTLCGELRCGFCFIQGGLFTYDPHRKGTNGIANQSIGTAKELGCITPSPRASLYVSRTHPQDRR